jgi:F0F1-type ATP synthase assembly protein I
MEMAGFTVAGVLIDWLTGWLPWATITLTLLGVVAAFVHLFRTVRKASRPGPEGDGP